MVVGRLEFPFETTSLAGVLSIRGSISVERWVLGIRRAIFRSDGGGGGGRAFCLLGVSVTLDIGSGLNEAADRFGVNVNTSRADIQRDSNSPVLPFRLGAACFGVMIR